MRPSCGRRRSAMSSRAMILMREMIAARQPRRRALRLVQHAVIAVADAQPVLERLDMDVGRLRLDRAGDDAVDQADHRRLAGEVLQPLGIVLERLARRLGVRRRGALADPDTAGRAPHRARSAPRPAARTGSPVAAAIAAGVNPSSGSATATSSRPSSLRHRQRPRVAQEARRQPLGEQRLAGRELRRARPAAGPAAPHRPGPGRARSPTQAGSAPCPAAGRSRSATRRPRSTVR